MPRRQTWVISCSPGINTVYFHAQETNLSYLLFPWNKYSMSPCPGDKLKLSLVPLEQIQYVSMPRRQTWVISCSLEQIQYISMPRRQTWVISCSPGTNTVCLHAQETNLSYLLFPWNKYSMSPCPGDKLKLSLVPLEQIQYVSMPRRQT